MDRGPHFSRASTFRTSSQAGIFSVSARSSIVASVGFFFPRSKKPMYVRWQKFAVALR